MVNEQVEDAPCNICLEIIPSDGNGLFCDGLCHKWYHPTCVDINLDEYHLINNLADKVKWFCNTCAGKVDRFVSHQWDIEDIINLHATVEKLVGIVKGVTNDNISLLNRVEKLDIKQNEILNLVHSEVKVNKQYRLSVEGEVNDISNRNGNLIETSSNGRSTPSNIDPDIVNKSTTVKVNGNHNAGIPKYDEDYPPLISDNSVDNNQSQWSTWRSKRSRNKGRKEPIIGSKTDSDKSSKVRAVSKPDWIFVSRLSTDCTKDDILDYLKDSGVENCECTELKTKFDSYKSFKIGVSSDLLPKVLTNTFWPTGTLVREFVQKVGSRSAFVPSQTFLGRNHPRK
jgi:hypothetical protein